MYCKYCGQQIDEDSIFCKHCGKTQETSLENNDDGKTTENIHHKKSSIKVELVKKDGTSEERARKVKKSLLKELFILALFVGTAFLVKTLAFEIANSSPYPEVTEEEQKAFNDAILKKQFPNGFPPIDEYMKGTWDREKYPVMDNIAFGIEAAKYLHWGDYKYDKEAYSLSQLEDLNQFRKDARYFHALDISNYVFWILLLGLPLLKYALNLYKWLFKTSKQSSH